ncbi:MAG TPA: SPW repeat protein [Ferrovibrio sp.]|uniref:SPW repeat protein n=1 Tax=Ferrovibrio sp. TaxID=1917215 RepID=UPI002ED507F1
MADVFNRNETHGRDHVGLHPANASQDAKRWQDWANMTLGILMAASPWLFGYTGLQGATMNAVIVGFLIFALSALALTLLDRWEAYINALLGIWLVLSPWMLDVADYNPAKLPHLGVGAFVLVIAALEIWQTSTPRA